MNGAVFSMSVDDGHPSDLRMAELLLRHGLRATFYVPLRNSEGPPVMTPAQLRELAAHFEVGSHTLDHRVLTKLDLHAALAQVGDGKAALEDVIGRAAQGFCYPGGKYRPLHRKIVASAGFRYARTTRNLWLDAGDAPFELPVTLQYYPHPRSVLLRNFVRGGEWRRRGAGLAAALRGPDWLQRTQRLFEHALARGAVFHLWCHSRDVDHFRLWRLLDQFLAEVARRVPPAQRLDNGQLVNRHCEGGASD